MSLLTILRAAASIALTLFLALWAGALLEGRLMQVQSVHSSLRAVSARFRHAVSIDYRTDVDHVLHLLKEVTAGVPRVVSDPEPKAFLMRFGVDGLELQVGF